MKLEPISQPGGLNQKTPAVEPKKWSVFLHQGFKHPRKMLKKVFDEKMLEAAGLDPDLRPGALTTNQWFGLWEIYGKNLNFRS